MALDALREFYILFKMRVVTIIDQPPITTIDGNGRHASGRGSGDKPARTGRSLDGGNANPLGTR